MQDLEAYAGTTSSSGQRTKYHIGAERDDFVLFSFDVSHAFVKEMVEVSKQNCNRHKERTNPTSIADCRVFRCSVQSIGRCITRIGPRRSGSSADTG